MRHAVINDMMKIALLLLFMLAARCAAGQEKSIPTDHTKPRLYNTSLPDPCIKCVIQAIKRTKQVKPYIYAVDAAKVVYEVDWYPAANPRSKPAKSRSGLLINVFKDLPEMRQTLAAYIYDYASGQLSLIDSKRGNQSVPVHLDSLDRLKIRNACFGDIPSKKQ